jgi:hypothetical protein
MNLYLDPYSYIRAATGHDTSQLVGNLCRLASPVAALATTLSLTAALTSQLNQYDQIYLFDGSASEIATLAQPAAVGATQISVQALASAHAAGVPFCSDGSVGSLAQCIIDASAAVESYCRQPLYQASYSAEELPLRTSRAMITRDCRVLIRPRRAPVQSVSAVALQIDALLTYTLDASMCQIDSEGWLVTVSQIQPTGNAQAYYTRMPIAQTTPGLVQISYVAGFAPTALPGEIRRAAVLLTSDLLADRRNPTGAAEYRQGRMQLVSRLRGDTSGDSVLTIRAHKWLDPYRQKI